MIRRIIKNFLLRFSFFWKVRRDLWGFTHDSLKSGLFPQFLLFFLLDFLKKMKKHFFQKVLSFFEKIKRKKKKELRKKTTFDESWVDPHKSQSWDFSRIPWIREKVPTLVNRLESEATFGWPTTGASVKSCLGLQKLGWDLAFRVRGVRVRQEPGPGAVRAI